MDNATLLAEAKAAYHDLMTGSAVVSVWYQGRRTEFRPANASQLKSYIEELERQTGGMGKRRAPAGVSF